MDMAFGTFAAHDEAIEYVPRSFAPPPPPRTLPVVTPTAYERTPYASRNSRSAIAAVAATHVLALYALVHFDVIAISKAPPQELAVTMVEVAPPPAPHEVARTEPTPAAETPVVAPPPIVALEAPAPAPEIVAAPPPPVPVVAAPAAQAAAPPVAASPPGPIAADILADVLDAPSPRFPAESRRLRESGTVRLRVVVSAEGRVAEVTVARSSGFDRLDKAALDAVRRWRFRPRVMAGSAVEAVGFVPVTFNPPH